MRLTRPAPSRSMTRSLSLLVGLSLLGCDPAQRDTTQASTSAYKLTETHTALVKAVLTATGSTDDLARPKACWDSFDYGAWLEDYLYAASQPDAAATGEALVALNHRLRCVSAAEFATFQYAVFNHGLISDDLLKTPELDAVEEELVPLVIMMHDMGGRVVGANTTVWLNAHADLISASLLKGHLAELGLFPAVYDNLRGATDDELALVADIITDGVTMDCSMSMLLNSGEDDPRCARECVPITGLTVNGEEIDLPDPGEECEAAGALQDFATDEALGEEVLDCLEAYIEDTGSADATVCIVTELADHVTDHRGMFDLTPRAEMRVADSCQVSQTVYTLKGVLKCDKPADADGSALWSEYNECLLDAIQFNELTPSDNDPDGSTVEYLQEHQTEAAAKLAEAILEESVKGASSGGSDNYCGPDDASCDEGCGIDSYALTMLETCYTAQASGEIETAPDPIDPIDPETDPDSALGQLETCLAKAAAAAAGDDGEECDETLDCGEGAVPEEIDGTCQCPLDTRVPLDIVGCDEQIECSEDDGSCTCDGAPLEGNIVRDPANPMPDPTTLRRIGLPSGSSASKK